MLEDEPPSSASPDGRGEEAPTPRPATGTRLGPYEIVSLLGAGGMGEVYKARDTRLDRTVAVKVLPAGIAGDEDRARRFEREARTISRLNHPHICALYDVGQHDGLAFLVMEYLEGESLAQRLAKGPLPLEDALRYATQIAEALDEAHGHGIVHRDLKPANVMLTRQGAKLLDFGIAKLRAGAVAEDAATATRNEETAEGVIVGTPQYMAPEQLEGKPVDARTDVFAFGVVLYQMVSGRKPFEGATNAELIAAILRGEPPPLSPPAPAALDRLVRRCLAKDPRQRWSSLRELLPALVAVGRRPSAARPALLAAGACAVLAAAALAFWLRRDHREPDHAGPATASKSIAVLPFQNLSADPDSAYFADGMTEDILTQLAKIRDMKVIARTSVMRYKGTTKPVREIARELGVGAVLEGSVRRAGNRVRVTGQLIDASTEQHLWAESYDREMQDVFAVQSDVAQRIADALDAKLTAPEKQRIERPPTRNLEAYDLYLRGRDLFYRYRKEDNEEALALFKKAVALDPDFAVAWAAIGDANGQRYQRFGFPASVLEDTVAAARRALQIDPNLAEGQRTLALSQQGKLTESIEENRKAAALKPSLLPAVLNVGANLSNLGRYDEALPWFRQAADLDPRFGVAPDTLGAAYDALGLPSLAEAAFRHSLELQPDVGFTHWHYVVFLFRAGRGREALEHARTALAAASQDVITRYAAATAEMIAGSEPRATEIFEQLLPTLGQRPDWHVHTLLARLYLRAGRKTDAKRVLDERFELDQRALAAGRRDYDLSLDFAFIYSMRGDGDAAVKAIQAAIDQGWRGYPSQPRWYPLFDPLRGDPRFESLMGRVEKTIAEQRHRASAS